MPITALVVDLRAFSAVARFVSDEEGRPTLQGVYVRPDGAICATNGYALLVWPNAARAEDQDARPCAIPEDFILATGKLPKAGDGALTLDLDNGAESTHGIVSRGAKGKHDQLVWYRIPGPYPNIARVIPRTEQLAPMIPTPQVDAALLARYIVPGEGKYSPVHQPILTPQSATHAVFVSYRSCPAIGVIIPLIHKNDAVTVPEWIHAFSSAEAAA